VPNRLTRDQIILEAVNTINTGNFRTANAPNGVVLQTAPAIGWLQNIIDFWHHMVPFSATIKRVRCDAVANQDYILAPTDLIVDVRNGYLVQTIPSDANSLVRRHRVSLQKFINRKLTFQKSTNINYPTYYCLQDYDEVAESQMIQITPTPNIATVGYLYYYAMPPALTAGKRPKVPNDYVCVEYVKIRAMEWLNLYEPGTAQKFCDKIVSGMKAAGLLNEPEDDEVPFDDLTFIHGNASAGYDVFSMIGPR
jgi:hypothetical protein